MAMMAEVGWMGAHAQQLANMPLCSLILPGTHDAGSYAITDKSPLAAEGRTIFAKLHPLRMFLGSTGDSVLHSIISNWSVTQGCTVYEQLRHGARYLDLRLGFCDNLPYIHHAKFSMPLEVVCEEIRAFLTEEGFEKEVVVVELSHFEYETAAQERMAVQVYLEILGEYCLHENEMNGSTRLEQVWQTKRRLVTLYEAVRVEFSPDLWFSGSHLEYKWVKQADLRKLHDGLKLNLHAREFVLRSSRRAVKKFHLTTTARDTEGLSAVKYATSNLRKFAGESKEEVVKWMEEWEQEMPGALNIYSVDFIEETRVVETAVRLNVRRAQAIESKSKQTTITADTASSDE